MIQSVPASVSEWEEWQYSRTRELALKELAEWMWPTEFIERFPYRGTAAGIIVDLRRFTAIRALVSYRERRSDEDHGAVLSFLRDRLSDGYQPIGMSLPDAKPLLARLEPISPEDVDLLRHDLPKRLEVARRRWRMGRRLAAVYPDPIYVGHHALAHPFLLAYAVGEFG